jgi:hypothetical protein
MEFVAYLPGAITAGWMAYRLVNLVRHGVTQERDEQNA